MKKALIVFSSLILMFGGLVSFGKTSHASFDEMNSLEIDERMLQAADKISSYFSVDENQQITFSATEETLVKELGISKQDAKLMLQAAESLNIESLQNQTRGFVGIHIHLGPEVRSMSGWAAGTFTAGYVGWYAKQFAVNPLTAGVAALITGGTALADEPPPLKTFCF